MTGLAILKQAATSGLKVSLGKPGHLRVVGNPIVVKHWITTLQKHKPEIIAALSGKIIDIQDFIDAVEERAAIMEFDADDQYRDRQAATAAAYEDCKIIYLQDYIHG